MARAKYLFKRPIFQLEYPVFEEYNLCNQLQSVPENEIDEIVAAFKKCELINSIKERYPYFSISSFTSQLPYVLSDDTCKKCGGAIYHRLDRNMSNHTFFTSYSVCGDCGHDDRTNCKCENCKREREEEIKQAYEIHEKTVHDFIRDNYKVKPRVEDISFMDKIRIALLASRYLEENYLEFPVTFSNYYNANYRHRHSKNPDEPEEIDGILKLIDKRILRPHTLFYEGMDHTSLEAETPSQLSYSKISHFGWELHLFDQDNRIDFETFSTLFDYKALTNEEKSLLWRYTYRKEVYRLTNFILKKYFSISMEEPLTDYLADMTIESANLAQVWAMINSANNATLRFQQLKSVSNTKSLETCFRNKLSTYIERSKNGKPFSEYERPQELGIDPISQFFLKDVLELNDYYFYAQTHLILDDYQNLD